MSQKQLKAVEHAAKFAITSRKSSITTALKAGLDDAVASGVCTQKDADEIVADWPAVKSAVYQGTMEAFAGPFMDQITQRVRQKRG